MTLPGASADHTLWVEAERAAAEDGLAPTLGGARRRRLLTWDALSTTWSGWDLQTGAEVWVQVLRPRWRRHPAMVRRFLAVRAPEAVRGFRVVDGTELPVRRLDRPGTTVAHLAPHADEEPVSLPLRAAVFAHGLDGLAALHAEQRGLGAPVAEWLTVSESGARLVDRVPFHAPFSPDADLRSLAQAVVDLAPEAVDPIATLARTWCERPPPGATDGAHLVERAMATHLAWLRHQLVRTRRSVTRGDRLGRLSRLLRRLDEAQQPPVGVACLAAPSPDQHVRVWSDGQTVRGGPVVVGTDGALPVVWSRSGGLDPVAGRLLVRAWSASRGSQRERATEVHRRLGDAAVAPELFVRWLKSARRLRSARLLLDAEARVRVVR